jgi:hypothetical protein
LGPKAAAVRPNLRKTRVRRAVVILTAEVSESRNALLTASILAKAKLAPDPACRVKSAQTNRSGFASITA